VKGMKVTKGTAIGTGTVTAKTTELEEEIGILIQTREATIQFTEREVVVVRIEIVQ